MTEPTVYPNAVILGLFSGIIVGLDLPPIIWHIQRRNFAASSLVFWVLLLNFTNFINAVIWPNSDFAANFDGKGLCDIEVKYIVASWAGLPCAVAAIIRGLAKVMDPEKVALAPSAAQKRRNLIIDILLIWACPIYLIAFHYIVQPNRYFIWPIAGCNPSLDNSWLSVILIFIWPCVFAIVDGYYAVLLVIRLCRYRSQFRTILTSHNTTKSRFLRLFLISLFCIVGLIPLSFYVLAQNMAVPHQPFSWSRVHDPQTWDSVIYFDDGGAVLFDRWIRIGAGVLIFAFFGTGQDAVVMYRGWLLKTGIGKIFPSLYQQHDSRRGSSNGSGSGAWLNWSNKARSFFSSTTSSKDTNSVVTNSSLIGTRTSHSNKAGGIRASTDSLATSSHDDNRPAASSSKSDRFFKVAATHFQPAERTQDGLMLKNINVNTTSKPAATPGTVDGEGKEDGESVVVKKEHGMEK